MIELVIVVAVLGFWLSGPIGFANLMVPPALRSRGPRRHARPKGWTGPPERAPFPPVASDEARSWIYPQDVEHYERHGLSHLNREVMRRRFRVMWDQAQAGARS